jgi:hypothetical protein
MKSDFRAVWCYYLILYALKGFYTLRLFWVLWVGCFVDLVFLLLKTRYRFWNIGDWLWVMLGACLVLRVLKIRVCAPMPSEVGFGF